MADEARPLSRRERRELEERAAAGVAPVPVASSQPEEWNNPVVEAADGSGLTRRDRRRLERLEQPMETWTAVEEMHHTGQIPTMTPEVIAQQEELARKRAAEAQADAVRATGEIHQVAAHQITPGAAERVTGEEPEIAPSKAPPDEPAISRFDMPDEAPRAPADDARRRLAQAAAAAAAALPTERERPLAPAPGHARQEHGILDAPRPPTSEVPALVDLTPPAGVPGVHRAAPPADPGPQTQPQSAFPGGTPPASPQQGPPSQPVPLPPSVPTPRVVQAAGPATAAVASAVAPASPPGVVGQVVPGAQQGAAGSPQPTAFGPPTGAVPAQVAASPYPPGTALSPVATGTLHPVLGQTGTMRAIPGGGPMTGTIPRPIVEVQPAGGAKDFGWPHIAVLAAVAFTLGIVVWKISGLGG